MLPMQSLIAVYAFSESLGIEGCLLMNLWLGNMNLLMFRITEYS